MHVIPIRRPGRRSKSARRSRVSRKKILQITGVLLGVFILLNAGLGLAYKNKLYPNSTLAGKPVGGKSLESVKQINYIPESVKLTAESKTSQLKLSSLDTKVDWQKTEENIKNSKSWLPLVNIFKKHTLALQISYNQQALNKAVEAAQKDFAVPSVNWTVVKTDKASLAPGKSGAAVNAEQLKKLIAQSITTTGKAVEVPLTEVKPDITDVQLKPIVDQLEAKRSIKLSYVYSGKSSQASSSDILSWYKVDGVSLNLYKTKISAYIAGLGTKNGIKVQNLSQLTTDTVNALEKQTSLSATLVAAPVALKKYTFCAKAKGVDESLIPAFAAKFTSTLNDSRSWSLDGKVSFSYVASGCDFTAWLARADLMSTFGAICDSSWSCAVRPNVIINYDRWRYASDAWNAAGGSLDDYRNMVINHETGHWLGFGHRNCGGAGQPAPVMQQQSISLQGCVFSPWPSAAEKGTLKAQLGI